MPSSEGSNVRPAAVPISAAVPMSPEMQQSPTQATHSHQPVSPQKQKVQKHYACLGCSRRKVKCDHKSPCGPCVKAGWECLAVTQARPRKRRFAERDLLDRLRRYETLMRKGGVRFEPLHGDGEEDCAGSEDGDVAMEDARVSEGVRGGPSPSVSVKSERPEVKNIFAAMIQETAQSTKSTEIPVSSLLQETLKQALDSSINDDHTLIFGFPSANDPMSNSTDLSHLHPAPLDIFRLWQIYLDNVDPLFKVTHTPTLQPRIIAAASDLKSVSPPLEALMFGIYRCAIMSLSEEDCSSMFRTVTQDELLDRFQFAAQQALMKANFLRSSDRECLTALFLYLTSLGRTTDPRSLSLLLGLAVQSGQRMGIHNESMLAKHTIFEAEMRRRLWWSLMLQDARLREKSQTGESWLSPIWDCKIPLDVNDAELTPDMKEVPNISHRSAPSEALLAVVRAVFADHVRNADWHLDFTNPILKPLAHPLPENGSLDALQRQLQNNHLKNCSPENPLHFLTIWMTRTMLAKSRLIQHYARYANPSDAQRDVALNMVLEWLTCDAQLMSPIIKGFRWHLFSYFPFPAYMHAITDLKLRPMSAHAEKAWDVLGLSYDVRLGMPSAAMQSMMKRNPLVTMFRRTLLGAWEMRINAEAEARAAGKTFRRLDVPRIVSGFEELHRLSIAAHAACGTLCVPRQTGSTGSETGGFMTPASDSLGGDGQSPIMDLAGHAALPVGPNVWAGMSGLVIGGQNGTMNWPPMGWGDSDPKGK